MNLKRQACQREINGYGLYYIFFYFCHHFSAIFLNKLIFHPKKRLIALLTLTLDLGP
ncbi:Uncharacterized protein dnm_020380 [Desulfonema magnum]|uniref:Uncharacterized protein n=1 Tax=Desulfonema magnum TaxID=45655 RepID=A0A975BJ30_9BACT|nr:Uncharacterized protein dnm_020380 [Desulfonema magnum]